MRRCGTIKLRKEEVDVCNVALRVEFWNGEIYMVTYTADDARTNFIQECSTKNHVQTADLMISMLKDRKLTFSDIPTIATRFMHPSMF